MKSLKLFLAVPLAVGITDDLGFVFNLGLLTSEGGLWMSVAALIWAANFFFAAICLHWRALWLLVGIPLVVLPFVVTSLAASFI